MADESQTAGKMTRREAECRALELDGTLGKHGRYYFVDVNLHSMAEAIGKMFEDGDNIPTMHFKRIWLNGEPKDVANGKR